MNVPLVNDSRHIAVPSALHPAGTSHPGWKEVLQISLVRKGAQNGCPKGDFVLYRRTCTSLAEFLIPDKRIIDTVKSIVAFATIFEIYYWTSLDNAKIADIVQDLLVSNFIRGDSLARCMQHVDVSKFKLRNPVLSEYNGSFAASMFGVTTLESKIMSSCLDSHAV